MLSTTPSIRAELKFLKWQPLYELEKPFQIFINIPDDAKDKRTTNLNFENVQIELTDARILSPQLSLDERGFVYRKHEIASLDYTNRKEVECAYLPEIESLLKTELDGVDQVFFFDWRLRINAPEVEGTVIDLNDVTSWLRPALHVHVDQSPLAVLNRVRLQLPDQADFLLQGRVRIVNIWRPLVDVVEDYPLAICDGSTVSASDLTEADHIRRHYTGSTMYLQYNQNLRFYYVSKQTKDEVLIFKNFDSAEDIAATCAPHASFLHPDVPRDFVPRKSIEVRALVFTYPPHE